MKITLKKGDHLWTPQGTHVWDESGTAIECQEDTEVEFESQKIASEALAFIQAKRGQVFEGLVIEEPEETVAPVKKKRKKS